jgi:hypothetical protein
LPERTLELSPVMKSDRRIHTHIVDGQVSGIQQPLGFGCSNATQQAHEAHAERLAD